MAANKADLRKRYLKARDDLDFSAIDENSRLVREREGLNVLPASMAGLIALIEQHRKEPLPNDRYVAILTGRK